MDFTIWVAVVTNAVGLTAVFFGAKAVKQAKRAADAAEAQVTLQRELAAASAQPYVWVDLRPDDIDGDKIDLVVGNAGPSVATNIRATFSPPLPDDLPWPEVTQAAVERLAKGLTSLGPGRVMHWGLGGGASVLESAGGQSYVVTVHADGPHGPCTPLQYVVDVSDLTETSSRPQGSLHRLTAAVDRLRKDSLPRPALRKIEGPGER